MIFSLANIERAMAQGGCQMVEAKGQFALGHKYKESLKSMIEI